MSRFLNNILQKTSIVGLGILTGGYTLFASFFYWFWNHALQVGTTFVLYFLLSATYTSTELSHVKQVIENDTVP